MVGELMHQFRCCCRSFSYRAKLLEHAGMDSVELLENALVETNKWTSSFLVFKS